MSGSIPTSLTDYTEKELQNLRRTDPVKAIVELLDKAQHKLGRSYVGTFDRFLDYAIAFVTKVQPVEVVWQVCKQQHAAGQLTDIDLFATGRMYGKMLEWYNSEVCKGLDQETHDLFQVILAILQYHSHLYLNSVDMNQWPVGPVGPERASPAHLAGPDLLGAIYMEYVVGRHKQQYNGQFFTPWHIAQAMAMILGPGESEADLAHTPEDPLRFGDPACGSGIMALAFFDQLRRVAPEIVREGRFYCELIDIDWTCCQMALLNLALCQVPLFRVGIDPATGEERPVPTVRIICGNALTMSWVPDKQREFMHEQIKQHAVHRREIDPEYEPTPPPTPLPQQPEVKAEQVAFDWSELEFKPKPQAPAPVSKAPKSKPKPQDNGQATLF